MMVNAVFIAVIGIDTVNSLPLSFEIKHFSNRLGPTAKLVNTGSSNTAGYLHNTLTKLMFHPVPIAVLVIANSKLGIPHTDTNRTGGIHSSNGSDAYTRTINKCCPQNALATIASNEAKTAVKNLLDSKSAKPPVAERIGYGPYMRNLAIPMEAAKAEVANVVKNHHGPPKLLSNIAQKFFCSKDMSVVAFS